MLATALDCVEHLCGKGRSSLLAPRAASMVRRLLGLAGTVPPAQSIALLCSASRLLVACPRIGTMFETPEGGAPMIAAGGFGVGVGAGAAEGMRTTALANEDADIDSPAAIHSTAWQLSELRKHYHPTVRELASKLAMREPFPTSFLRATPLSIMNAYSDANGAFHPAPQPPKAHRLASAAASAAEKGKPAPTLGAVPASGLEAVRSAVEEAKASAGVVCSLPFVQGVR